MKRKRISSLSLIKGMIAAVICTPIKIKLKKTKMKISLILLKKVFLKKANILKSKYYQKMLAW